MCFDVKALYDVQLGIHRGSKPNWFTTVARWHGPLFGTLPLLAEPVFKLFLPLISY